MAIMYPRRLLAGATQSAAEERLFKLFEKHLDTHFMVFHSRSLLARDKRNHVAEREIDFLVAHPDLGLLALEVKGGSVSIDGSSGQWSAVDRNGVSHQIKNPAKQAQDAVHDLVKQFPLLLPLSPCPAPV